MKTVTRRSVLRGSAALAATGVLARPHIANAAATTATVMATRVRRIRAVTVALAF